MFRFINSNLPSKALPQKIIPAFHLFSISGKRMAPFLRINAYSSWTEDPGWVTEQSPTPEPAFSGVLYKQEIDVNSIESFVLAGYGQRESSIEASLNTLWVNGSVVSLYGEYAGVAGVATLSFYQEFEDINSAIYTFSVPDGLSVSGVSTDDAVSFEQIYDDPGSFFQLGQTLSVVTSSVYSIPSDGEVLATGDLAIAATPALKIFTFMLPEYIFVDRFEWLGKSFSPTEDSLNPQQWEFTWDGEAKMLNVFLPLDQGTPRYSQSGGSVPIGGFSGTL